MTHARSCLGRCHVAFPGEARSTCSPQTEQDLTEQSPAWRSGELTEAACGSTGLVTAATAPRSTTPSPVTQEDAVPSKSPHPQATLYFLCMLASQKNTLTDRRERWLESGELPLLSSPLILPQENVSSFLMVGIDMAISLRSFHLHYWGQDLHHWPCYEM